MVLGWKYLHSMQRFWRGFWHFGQNDQNGQIPSKPLHGMGVLAWIGHFGHFGQKWVKTRCVSDKMSRFARQGLRRLSSGDEFWLGRLSARDPGKIRGRLPRADRLVGHAASFGATLGICSGTRCVSGKAPALALARAGFTRIPRRIQGEFGFGPIWL